MQLLTPPPELLVFTICLQILPSKFPLLPKPPLSLWLSFRLPWLSFFSHQTDCFPNLPLQVARCNVLAVLLCLHYVIPSQATPSPERTSLLSRDRPAFYFSSGRGCLSSRLCSIIHPLAVTLRIIERFLLHHAQGWVDGSMGRGSTPCRAGNRGRPSGHIWQEQILKQCSHENQSLCWMHACSRLYFKGLLLLFFILAKCAWFAICSANSTVT